MSITAHKNELRGEKVSNGSRRGRRRTGEVMAHGYRGRLIQATAKIVQERWRRRIRDIQKLPGQTELSPVDGGCRGDSRGLARSRSEAEQHPWKMLQPARTSEASSESILQPPMHPFHQPIGLRVEGRGEGVAEVEAGGES
jgi:hypothetical protein